MPGKEREGYKQQRENKEKKNSPAQIHIGITEKRKIMLDKSHDEIEGHCQDCKNADDQGAFLFFFYASFPDAENLVSRKIVLPDEVKRKKVR